MKIPTINYVYDRRHVANSDRKGNVDMVITYNRERKYISTGVQCLPHQWTGDRKGNVYVKGTGADVEMNQILLTMYQKAYKIISGMVEGGNVDISAIPTLLKAQNVDMTFLDYIRKRMEERNVTPMSRRRTSVTFPNGCTPTHGLRRTSSARMSGRRTPRHRYTR